MVREPDFVDEYYVDKDLSLLKKLTLVIPTYNRNFYLSRCLWYHAHFPFGQIIVADSSPEEKKIVNREIVAKVREIFEANVLYLEYEPETEKYGGDIYRKWGDAIQYVGTEYSQIVTDKEFLIPIALLDSIAYLDTHLDYVAADGRYSLIKENLANKYSVIWRPKQESLEGGNKYDRLLRCHYQIDPLMSTYRSEIHKQIYQTLNSCGLYTLGFNERFLDLFPFILGKYHHNATLNYSYRDLSKSYTNKGLNLLESSYARYPKISQYPETLYVTQYKILRDFIVKQVEGESSVTLFDVINNYLNEYLHSFMGLTDKSTIMKSLWQKISMSIYIRYSIDLFKNFIQHGKIINKSIDTDFIIEVIDYFNSCSNELFGN